MSVLFNQLKTEYILTRMKVKLLAARALLVKSAALLVAHKCFINFFAIVQCNAQAGRQVISTALAAPQRKL
jgi:hypothetical protein